MGVFSYQVVDKSGILNQGRLQADNEMAASEKLRKMGFTVLEMQEHKTSSLGSLFKGKRKVKLGELSLFSRQLSAMLEAGIPLTRTLFTLSKQADNPTLKSAVGEIARSVEGGMNFSDSLRAYPDIFNDLYVSMIQAGEAGGSLEIMLRNLSTQLEHEKILKDQIKSATFYPIVVACFAVVVILAMLIFIIPVFIGFLPKTNLPLPTRIIIFASESVRSYWYAQLLVLAVLVFGVRKYIQSPTGMRAWDKTKFRVPAFGPLFHKAVIARFSRTMSTLLSGGLPVMQALEAAGPASGNILVQEAVKIAGEKIHEGKSIAAPLEESGLFPPMVIQMVSVGEETGNLPFLLGRLAEFYEAEVSAMTKGLTALIEPLMIIFVGIIVGGMVVAMYLPIFQVVTAGAK